jgi:hypothetical protein
MTVEPASKAGDGPPVCAVPDIETCWGAGVVGLEK